MIILFLCLFSSCLTWTPNVNNTYSVGQIMQFNGSCYMSQNASNGWVTPGTNSWFWYSVDCATNCPAAKKDSTPSTPSLSSSDPDSLLTVAAGQLATSKSFWGLILIGFAFGVALSAKSQSVRAVIELVRSGDKEDSYN